MDTQNLSSRPLHYCLPGTTVPIAYDLAWLLLTAPAEQRLDLALASIMHSWKLHLSETVQGGKKVLVPVWYFQKFANNPRLHFTHTLHSMLPGIAPSLMDQVPYYSCSEATDRLHGANRTLREWLFETGIEYILQYNQTLGVQLKSNSSIHVLKEPEGLTLPCREVRMAALLARATVELLASDLVPYLESKVSFPTPDLTELVRQEARKPLYQVILLPSILGNHRNPECMYQEWDPLLDRFFSCAALKRMRRSEKEDEEDEEKDNYALEQCPCCGGSYCEHHYSHVQQEFALTVQEISWYGKFSAPLRICCNCALLEEPVRLAVRTAFLLANGKQPYAPDPSLQAGEHSHEDAGKLH